MDIHESLSDLRVSRLREAALAMVALAFVLVIASSVCLAPARGAPPEQAVNTSADKPGDTPPFNLDYITDDSQFMLALRPAPLAGLASLAPFKEIFAQLGVLNQVGLPLEEIEEFRFLMNAKTLAPSADPEDRPWPLIMLRAKQPHDWSKMATHFVGKTEVAIENGQTYFRMAESTPGMATAYWFPDDRTVVIASDSTIVRTFTLRGLVNPVAWAGKWSRIANSPAALVIKVSALQFLADQLSRQSAEPSPSFSEEADVVLFTGQEVAGVFQIAGTIECWSAEGAEKTKAAVQSLLALIRQQLVQEQERAAAPVAGRPNIPQIVLQLLDDSKIEIVDSTVRSRTVVNAEIGRHISKAIAPARDAVLREQSANKLKQIALALHNYHNAHNHLPPASVTGPDGKTPHSWRVELLPYLEKQELYDRYKMDEPWDSKDNLALVKEAADVFSVPGAMSSDDCGYFLVTGPGTLFDGNPEPTFRNVTDGTTYTIGLVEAKRSIPWTKPEDVQYDADKPLPKLGGHFEDGFHVGFLDGSVTFLPTDFDEATLRAAFTDAGGEPIQRDPTSGQPSLRQP